MSDFESWHGSKTSADKAAKELAKEIARREKRGYSLVTSALGEAGRSKRSWLALGVLNLARGKQVQATATFRRVKA